MIDDSTMKRFFDANDIAPGYRFDEEISYSQYNLLTTQKCNLSMKFVEKHTNTIGKLQNRCYYNFKYA